MSDKFKIFLNHTTNAGVAYYRMINPAKYMRRESDIEVAYSHFNPNLQNIADWEFKLMSPENKDIIINDINMLMQTSNISVWQMLHNKLSISMFLAYRRLLPQKKLVMEIDDWVFGVNPESMASDNYFPNSDLEFITERQILNASSLVVSTDFLKKEIENHYAYWKVNKKMMAEYYRRGKYSESANYVKIKRDLRIDVIPNSIDFDIWDKLKKPKPNKRIRIGWSGGQAHVRDLRILKNVIPRILAKYDVEFVFFGLFPDYLEVSDRVIHHDIWYSIDKYPQALADLGLDIGLAPLCDNVFNRCKSNLRWLEYSALQIPTVASDVEPFKGCSPALSLCSNEEEWVSILSKCIEEKKIRLAYGMLSYNTVKDNYNTHIISKCYVNLLKELDQDKSLEGLPIYS